MASILSSREIISANRQELLHLADSVAREKSVTRAEVLTAIEETVARSMSSRFGPQRDIRAQLNPDSGEIRVFQYRRIVETVEDPIVEIALEDAQLKDPNAEVGGEYVEELPLSHLERTGSTAGKQIMHQKVREAERKSQYEEFKDRVGDIISGTVKLVERGNVIVDVQRGEATMRRDQSIPRESFRIGDRIRALIVEVQNEHAGPQVLLSRASPEYMLRLFAQEVPEVYDGIIEIRAVARDPGSRAKIAVVSKNYSIDPVGACVGMRGSRVQTIVNELHGERIDIISWSMDPERFITDALQPARVVEVILDPERKSAEVIVPSEDDNQSKAIGRRGQNVRLASKLTGWHIDILTEEMYSEREAADREARVETFVKLLGISEHDAMLLYSANVRTLHDVVSIDPDEFREIDGIDPALLDSVHRSASEKLEQELDDRIDTLRARGMEDDLLDFLAETGLPIEAIEAVANHEDRSKKEPVIRTLRQFADLSLDELLFSEHRVGNRVRRRAGILFRFFGEEGEEDVAALIRRARVEVGEFTEEEIEEILEAAETNDTAPEEPTGTA